jgi:hypothetical protein
MTNFDQEQALAEGWGVFEAGLRENGSARIEIQRFDDAKVFANDHKAWTHVVGLARQGSQLHRVALELVDARERRVIEQLCGPW